ncbi:ras-domain-containing protein [Westerdykella ornata]|uniref:Ras-domain-containing protein n=1 Tax=Westerdykella ornata TaxID=318751 RepID=A0A6A6JGM1_WESOR|nr:ras-domain-containing protein [Westerdykella ornata]KAF2275572.1 ras-domain-containing protein [Westerdykella ornata]
MGEYHIVVFGANAWKELYVATTNSHRKNIDMNGRHFVLDILEASGTEQLNSADKFRELDIKTAHGFLLVFSVTSQPSFDELTTCWKQIQHIKKDVAVPLVLVGNKSDTKDDRSIVHLQVLEAFPGLPYYETSARLEVNVDEAFLGLCRQILDKNVRVRQSASADESCLSCTIL